MPEKLLTLKELSEYLEIKEKKLVSLVDEGVISAYKIGGELLRFRKDQIDAIKTEIESRLSDEDRIIISEARKKVRSRYSPAAEQSQSAVRDKIADFFYFNDFYIISAILIAALAIWIFRG